jgi:hypothetical protein
MSPMPEVSPYPGAFFVLGCAFVVTACIRIAYEMFRDWKLDRDISRAFREAKRLGMIREDGDG